jgi:hypothetical protein
MFTVLNRRHAPLRYLLFFLRSACSLERKSHEAYFSAANALEAHRQNGLLLILGSGHIWG